MWYNYLEFPLGGGFVLEKRLLRHLDLSIVLIIFLLVGIGLMTISSATNVLDTGNYKFIQVQAIGFILGIIAVILMLWVDYNTLGSLAYFIYAGSILFLLMVKIPGIGVIRNGARSWIDLGFISIQPSEFAKIGFIISLAKLLESRESRLENLRDLLVPVLFLSVPLVLVLTEPDLGGALVFIAIFAGMVFAAGISYKLISWGIMAVVSAIPPAWLFILEPHQKERLMVFLNPNLDPLGGGYHVIQSKIAVGSGRFFGKGLFKGTQNKLNFLPEQHTDFIFSVLGEELGFIGAVIVVALLFLLLFRILDTARQAKDRYGSLLAVGVLSMLTFQIFENIGMTIGLMPVTGITLPFMSYGGSSMLVNMIAIGLVLNVGMRKQKINF